MITQENDEPVSKKNQNSYQQLLIIFLCKVCSKSA